MILNIKTTALECHVAVYVISHGHELLHLSDTDEGYVELLPNIPYTIIWEAWTGGPSTAIITSGINPANEDFPLCEPIVKIFENGGSDGNEIQFTLKAETKKEDGNRSDNWTIPPEILKILSN